MTTLKVISLFDGISGTQQALKNLGIECQVYASEIDKYAIQVTQKNFPETVQLGDVKDCCFTRQKYSITDYLINITDGETSSYNIMSDIDLLSFGSPCQGLSIAKKERKGLDDSRSSLFYEAVRILNEVKPRFFLMENVNSMSKEVKAEITSNLYGIEPTLINSSLLTGQNRKRLYWCGKLQADGTYARVDIPQPQDKNTTVWEILQYKADIKAEKFGKFIRTSEDRKNGVLAFYKSTKRLGHFNSGGQGDRVYSRFGKSVCLSANGGGRGARTGLYLTAHNEIRKLTPTECARLQGFPDNYCDNISHSQAYKCYGNSFTVPVIEHILNQFNF